LESGTLSRSSYAHLLGYQTCPGGRVEQVAGGQHRHLHHQSLYAVSSLETCFGVLLLDIREVEDVEIDRMNLEIDSAADLVIDHMGDLLQVILMQSSYLVKMAGQQHRQRSYPA
jgi:hypothetical protein